MPHRTAAVWPSRVLAGALLALGLMTPSIDAGAAAAATTVPSQYCFERTLDDGRPRDVCIRLTHYAADVCSAIQRFAADFDLPAGYFARLIWQESHFDANAVSAAGAEGIAQFMPSTGRLQGLVNPYDPAEELWRSARYLRTLADRYGNLGLAAAAYNGGEGAASRFIAGTGYLAAETLDYVRIVTGVPVTQWLADDHAVADYSLASDEPFQPACVEMAATGGTSRFTPPTAVVKPWGIQMAQFFSSATARRAFARIQDRFGKVLGGEQLMLVAKRNPNFGPALRYTAEVGRDSRAAAEKLCESLRKAGGACIVVRN
ncbi:MAG TPA: lytic transglycosylase domain-containing protein [Alphaproteobacteria bacterium]|nr:lytic transglycosylase domain-containing protein [Alphaproteobacteria bacterium]